MILLGFNIDHCATIRQARYRQSERTVGGPVEPDPVTCAILGERAGADGITVHLRGDRRHIQDRDIELLREVVTTYLNVEMAATDEMQRNVMAATAQVRDRAQYMPLVLVHVRLGDVNAFYRAVARRHHEARADRSDRSSR